MERRIRPIRGFGRAGWILLPVAAGLAYCALGGYDLRFAIQRYWFDAFGWGGTAWLTTVPLVMYNRSLWSPVFGPICLTYLLLSLFLAPRRWRWWVWCLAVAWTVLQPALWWDLGVRRLLTLGNGMSTNAAFTCSGAVLALLTAGGLWAMTRFYWVVATFLTATAGALLFDHITSAVVIRPLWIYYLVPIAWHCAVGGSLVAWAIIERRLALREEWRCPECGYDLRGIAPGFCPECGTSSALPPA